MQNPKNYSNYYFNKYQENNNVVLSIQKVLKSGNYYNKYVANVTQVNSEETVGKILLNIKKDSAHISLQVGNQLFLKPEFKKLIPPLNLHQFSYKDYLAKQHIYHQIFTSKSHYRRLNNNHYSLITLSASVRRKIQTSLKKHNFSKNEYAVINALLLGQRQEISKELLQDYTNAGAIHILAISGLHIGIILLILSFLFKPIERFKNGRLIKSILIILLLWMFAFIAGLSASVMRAVTMFSFVAIGASFKKKKIIEHSLISSMFLLLLIKPLFLFDVGFQLSYLAVFGIVWVQPLLYNLWKPNFWLLDNFWRLFTVSVAAQTGILPISLYYFHQFPALFILSNLIIIPFLGGILIGGILIITLSLLNILPQLIADFYGWIISFMNETVSWISNKEEFLFKEISMSFIEMIVWYLFIVLAFRFLISKNIKRFRYFLISIILVQSVYIFEAYQRNNKQELIVFHKSRKNLIGIRNSKKLELYHNLDSNKIDTEKSIIAYRINENIKSDFSSKKPTLLKFKSDTILIVDSLGIYQFKSIKNPIVLLQNSPKINLNRLIKKINPKQIVADGSNYKSYISRWNMTCRQRKTPFYHTGQNGAYIIK
ncbi:ComEC/Rec2 family competence protein [Tenacibaculum pelagium]|uniref:ComEC/Rec2 family competence protein n=1 Tax=Tenacibaculum pelagium TaxID=2759527 RepID=UPI00293BD003|nr:ComEC/Rec2 family competence protein [Tenacibaculum pelagium]